MTTDGRTFGAHIAHTRKARGFSQTELAAELEVTRTQLSSWENDRRVPRRAQLEALAEVLADPGLLTWSVGGADEPPRLAFGGPMSLTLLRRNVVRALLENLSEDLATDGQPGYGWRHELDDDSWRISALSTAFGLRAVMLAGGRDWQVSQPRVREMLRRLELPDGGWSAQDASRLARPEVTAVVLSALHDAGEEEEYIAEHIGMVTEALDRRIQGAEPARPYVLASTLLELSRLGLDDDDGRRFAQSLVDLAEPADGGHAWPVVVRPRRLGTSTPSTTHTACAVTALTAWARRLNDLRLLEFAMSGRTWLEANADLGLDDEAIRTERADGGEEEVIVRHLTAAWVLRALMDTGADAMDPLPLAALRAVGSHYSHADALWRWPGSGGSFPVWMTWHGLVSIAAWVGARDVG
jgi:transcriptional regulator with XRE-family HTH domain